jgi:hypothetical protein
MHHHKHQNDKVKMTLSSFAESAGQGPSLDRVGKSTKHSLFENSCWRSENAGDTNTDTNDPQVMDDQDPAYVPASFLWMASNPQTLIL